MEIPIIKIAVSALGTYILAVFVKPFVLIFRDYCLRRLIEHYLKKTNYAHRVRKMVLNQSYYNKALQKGNLKREFSNEEARHFIGDNQVSEVKFNCEQENREAHLRTVRKLEPRIHEEIDVIGSILRHFDQGDYNPPLEYLKHEQSVAFENHEVN